MNSQAKEDNMKNTILELQQITVKIGSKEILSDISCQVEEGDSIVIVGGNGAGKTTFFDTICGKHIPCDGKLFLNTLDMKMIPEPERMKKITRIFQNTYFNCVGSLTVWQNLAISHLKTKRIGLSSVETTLSEKEAKKILESGNISSHLLHQKMNDLSGGQRQLISFLIAMELSPKLLLLDEPTAALDPESSTKLLQLSKQFVKEKRGTLLLITHDPLIALHFGNKIWVLEKGKITNQYTEEEKNRITDPVKLIGQIDYASLR
jgi:putative ABC transport system ATP-binding protein